MVSIVSAAASLAHVFGRLQGKWLTVSGLCRRRKIRCLLSSSDPQGRCSNCIRLKKKCNFYAVEQHKPQEQNLRRSNNYWTGVRDPARAASRSSSMNSSLHGYPIFDPQEQNMDVSTSPRPQSSHSQGNGASLWSAALPPPPVKLPCLYPFECDICGLTILVKRKRDWK